ncbi:DUF4158 domain-containing protein [Methylococcus sp. EFPC2]|uniref:DUF4158 domain-containing protein n=1 Tax=Methylococcus sp. EFPC2 TaxID=2812648 RepID=UPI001F080A01|nr:DUF4158 domain-containing protein [Methylococcus sp. EFPC2]
MSTDDDRQQTVRRRRLALPAEPSEDELARNWSLASADLVETSHCRGDDQRRRYALRLCMLRTYGRFLDDYRQAPLRIVNHLSRQLQLAPVLVLDHPDRAQTEREQALRIRRYLGLQSFDEDAEARLRDWLREGVLDGRNVAELLARVEDRLRDWQIVLPAPSTLDRIVTSEAARATTALFDTVANQLPDGLRAAIDLLIEVPKGDARSSLFRLKDYPKNAKASTIKGDIVRLHLIEELLADGNDLAEIDPKIIRQFGQLGRRYDAGDLRRFAKPKRDALVGCYLIEARKTLLDQLVEMNDQFLTGMNRRAQNAVKAKERVLRRRARSGLDRLLGAVDALAEADGEQTVQPDDPQGFVPAAWRLYLVKNGKVDRHIWEIALAFAIRDTLRAGNLFLAQSREHASFWNLVYDERRGQATRNQAYSRLDLLAEPQAFLGEIVAALERAARTAARGLSTNRFAAVQRSGSKPNSSITMTTACSTTSCRGSGSRRLPAHPPPTIWMS